MRRHQTGWHAVVDGLLRTGHDTAFGLPADDLGLLRAAATTDLRLVLCRDQRNAVYMATGYARAAGRTGVCIVGKGPAVGNAVAGLLEPHTARTPMLLLATGTASAHKGSAAFQELDQTLLVRPLVKWAHRVESPERICEALDKALTIAPAGCPGPVYLELPEQLTEAPATQAVPWTPALRQFPAPDPAAAGEALVAIRAARRPLLLVGGGMVGRGGAAVLDLAGLLGAGVFVTASGRGTVDERHPLFCGLAGLYAAEPYHQLWQQCDLVIALGTRLEETAVFGWDGRTPPPLVVQVNLGETEFSSRFPGPRVLGDGVAAAVAWSHGGAAGTEPGWTQRVRGAREDTWTLAGARIRTLADDERLGVAEVLEAMQRLLPDDVVLVQENGLQDMWSYHYPYWVCASEGGSLVPSEQTSLGFGAAAAVGVRVALPDRPVAALVGDGAFAMFGADLVTAVRERIPVLWIVLDNGGYGWLEHQLRENGLRDSRFSFTDPPLGLAGDGDTAGLHRRTVHAKDDLDRALADAWAACLRGCPAVLRILVSLDDTPPGLEQLAGDFPEPVTVHE